MNGQKARQLRKAIYGKDYSPRERKFSGGIWNKIKFLNPFRKKKDKKDIVERNVFQGEAYDIGLRRKYKDLKRDYKADPNVRKAYAG